MEKYQSIRDIIQASFILRCKPHIKLQSCQFVMKSTNSPVLHNTFSYVPVIVDSLYFIRNSLVLPKEY